MRIYACKLNHLTDPLGYDLRGLTASWKVTDTEATRQESARILLRREGETVLDTGFSQLDSIATPLDAELLPRTRYEWQVEVKADNGDTAVSGWNVFETAKLDEPWEAGWIGSPLGNDVPPLLRKTFRLDALPRRARAYITGVGLYELSVNGQKVSDEYLLPGCTDYSVWLQYQTFDLAPYLKAGENEVSVALGDGWYKGRFGYIGSENNYGDHYALLAELRLDNRVIGTDESWQAAAGDITFNNIYDGEVFAPKADRIWTSAVALPEEKHALVARNGAPVRVQTTLPVAERIRTPKDEWVMDFGQNMSGFVRFRCKAPAGTKVFLQFGEILQDGCFYRDNLRSAKAEYTYLSDGKERVIEPKFTFYGFRFMKVQGLENPDPADFTACAIWSDFDETGFVTTGNAKVDRLIQNARWGQRSNYVDVPTDCPQRDERMGWTADTQVFTGTACWLSDVYSFLSKYVRDMAAEQSHNGGLVPNVIPSFHMPGTASVWGDAATIIPWTLYTFFGDRDILEKQYDSMRDWVEYIRAIDKADGNRHLWLSGFQFGDWLALDNEADDNYKGGTDDYYIASAYYYNSVRILAKSACVLGKTVDSAIYGQLAGQILKAIRAEYFSATGRLAITTQTGYVLALQMGLCPPGTEQKTAEALEKKLRAANVHLKTGFVGTAFLCRVLSGNGLHPLAVRLLLNEDYPGWLYAVNMGATTIWERWNSVLPDGHLSGTDMNSLNHYSYGSILEWIFRVLGGLEPREDAPGFRRVTITPKPHFRLPETDMRFDSPCGLYRIHWVISPEGLFTLDVTVPFGAEAVLTLPNKVGPSVKLKAGIYHYEYTPDTPLCFVLSADTPLEQLMEEPEGLAALKCCGEDPNRIPPNLRKMTLRQLSELPSIRNGEELLRRFEEAIRK